MVTQWKYLIGLALTCFLVLSCGSKNKNEKVLIACCSNFYPIMSLIADDFQKTTGNQIEVINGSSGSITAQIRQGAPYQIFFSADQSYPDTLFESGLGKNPVDYCQGQLVIWSMKENVDCSEYDIDFYNLTVALPNPSLAPYGKAALQMMTELKYYRLPIHRFVKGESVSQTNQFVYSKSADLGFTSLSTIKFLEEDPACWKIVDSHLYDPVIQSYIILDSKEEIVSDFLDYFHSEKSQNLLLEYGYIAIER